MGHNLLSSLKCVSECLCVVVLGMSSAPKPDQTQAILTTLGSGRELLTERLRHTPNQRQCRVWNPGQ